ncbi:MAG: hypothetical protein B9S38_07770 [Verrucomicrobiia bacterium Tous-C4TDCM]|nr:MAG: hypothetical protein B9S38_07770 [Verrucomicrobiae bacterium Tous-C4TDCM]
MPPTIETIPIGNLPVSVAGKEVAFRIPAYQRGYRWTQGDVAKLLRDLKEFLDDGENGSPFYCLQPLVVKKGKADDRAWEVVDGQQRLTTLFLLWKFLDDRSVYDLSYETRNHSKDFLNSPAEDRKAENIDFHHIYYAYQAIQTWFEGNETEKDLFRELLADVDPNGRNVRFIWYELDPDDDAVSAFTRLNVGKIPLADVELIRALFLRNPEAGRLAAGAFQHRLALEWDRIETALQEPDFWAFLSNQDPPDSGRISLLFELSVPSASRSAERGLFDHYQARLLGERAERPYQVWQEIVACFEQLEEWYRNPELFHLVGYRTTILEGKSIETLNKLLEDAKGTTKPKFAAGLRAEIRKLLVGDGKAISDLIDGLDYLENPKLIRPSLALFNIATLLRTQGVAMRFPFHYYHAGKWDLEHVHSQAGQDLSKRAHQKGWLNCCVDEIQRENPEHPLVRSINAFTGDHPEAVSFDVLHNEVTGFFGESKNAQGSQGIGNLTLLDESTNRGYGNAPFAVKRSAILKAERDGTFILPCTRDLFLKVFSENPGNLRRWDIEKDGTSHQGAIRAALENFFGEKMERAT